MKNLFFKSNTQKVLRSLLQYSERSLLPSDIKKDLKISRAGIHSALQELLKKDLIQRKQKGKAYVYQAKSDLLVLKQLKVLDSAIKLQSLVKRLSPLVDKIILFGSCSRGENTEDSDIDLLIISYNKEGVKEELKRFMNFRLKPIIKTPVEFVNLEKKDPTFYLETIRGIILFAKSDGY
jgi:predicted nucleotidyltransferase